MPKGTVLGIDIGGTKLAVGIVDLDSGIVKASLRAPTPVHLGGAGIYKATLDLCSQLPEINNISAIGVCFGGQVYENHVLRSNQVEGWEDFPLEARLQADLAHVPVRIVNDANAIAWLEWTKRKENSLRSLFYVTVSTGVGGGFVLNGQIVEGRNGLASEIGHMILVPDGAEYVCGKKGCLEALASGLAISRVYAGQTQQNLSAKEIAKRANDGEETAIRVLQVAGNHVGRALAATNMLLDVDLFVLGGGVSRSGDIWWSAVTECLNADIPYWGNVPQIASSTFGELEGILAGATATYNRAISPK